MNAREEMLSTLRRQIVDQIPLPDTAASERFISYEDRLGQLKSVVEMVGGSCFELASRADLLPRLEQFEQWAGAQRIYSKVAEIPGNVDLNQVDDPHDLENLDFVVYPGEFAVSENGAVWLTSRELRHRVVFFITQYLILVVNKESVVDNMHQAYEKAVPPQPGFGLFLSGPSKTADIEQSLVIGAHGCREMQVYLV